MARLPRFILPGQPQHVILRGNNRTEIFWVGTDYRFYLDKLRLAWEKYDGDIHANVSMTNPRALTHYTPRRAEFEQSLESAGTLSCAVFNHCYGAPVRYGKGATKLL